MKQKKRTDRKKIAGMMALLLTAGLLWTGPGGSAAAATEAQEAESQPESVSTAAAATEVQEAESQPESVSTAAAAAEVQEAESQPENVSAAAAQPAEASTGKRIVRVGYYITPGFQELDETTGKYRGYSYEYLLALAQYANWEYEFVPVSFSDGVTMLEQGELDLMNNVSRTDEREAYLSYSNSSSGSNCAYLAMNVEGADVAYEDFHAFNGLTVALVTTSINSDRFLEYCKENNCSPRVKYYDTKEEAIAALETGEADARIITSSQNIDMHIIGKFAPEEYYFAVPKEETDLLRELNLAMSSLKTNDPGFETRMDKKYYDDVADENTILTAREKQFVQDHSVITVAYDEECYPLSYTDADGNFAGTIADIYGLLSEYTGLQFSFQPCSASSLEDLSSKNEMMLYAEIPYSYIWAADYGITLTPPFTDITVVEARRRGFTGTTGIMAVVDGYYLSEACQESYGDSFTYATYASTKDCMEAVQSGKADMTCLTSYEGDYYQSRSRYREVSFSVSQKLDYSLSIGVSNVSDPSLFSIMMKGLNAISTDTKDALFKATSIQVQQPDTLTMLLNHPTVAIPVLLILASLVVGLVFVLIYSRTMKKKNLLINQKNEQLAEAVVQADRANVAKSQFLSRMSHEIRTPMNAIVGLTAIARQHEQEPEKIDDYLVKIDVSSKVLLNIINDILDMSAIESDKLKIANTVFDIKQLLNGIATIYYPQCESKGIHFEMASDIEHEILVGDSLRVNQVLLNLVSNAYKFTEKSGSIRIYVEETSQKENTAFLRFTVSDTGCGMSPEMQERLFRPFEQETADTAKKHGGSGLGLSIAKNLVDMMHGAVKVQSEQGKGTTFVVDLPFEMSSEKRKPDKKMLKSLRILAVDDDPSALEYTTTVLKRIGVSFDTASSGRHALEKMRQAETEQNPYNVCLVDWKMPDLDGIDLTRQIREKEGNKSLVIIASAYDLNEVEDEAKEAGADYFVTKPLFQSTLFDALMTLCGGQTFVQEKKGNDYDFSGFRVLLAEDNEINAEIAMELLGMVHLEAERAENGEKAVQKFEESPMGTYDVILMDVQMPVMDGYEATKTIRKLEREDAKQIPILAMTANAFTEDISAALSAGMNGHIAKPIDTQTLYQTLADILQPEKE